MKHVAIMTSPRQTSKKIVFNAFLTALLGYAGAPLIAQEKASSAATPATSASANASATESTSSSPAGNAQITSAPPANELRVRHAYFLRGEVEGVMGQYMLAIRNSSSAQQSATIPLMLPKETYDFEPIEGILPEQIQVGTNGQMEAKLDLPVGDTTVVVGFRVKSSGNQVILSLLPIASSDAMAIYISNNDPISIAGDQFTSGESGSHTEKYRFYQYKESPIPMGIPIQIKVLGVDVGRSYFKMLLYGFIGLLLISSIIMAIRSRPSAEQTAS